MAKDIEVYGAEGELVDDNVMAFLGKLTLLGKNSFDSDVRAGAIVPRGMRELDLVTSRWQWDYYSPGMVGALLVARITDHGSRLGMHIVSSVHLPARCDRNCATITPYNSVEPPVPSVGDRPILSLFTEEDRSTRTLPILAAGAEVVELDDAVVRTAYGNLLDTHHSLLPLRDEFTLPPVHPEITSGQ